MIRRLFFLMVMLMGYITQDMNGQVTNAVYDMRYNKTTCQFEVYYSVIEGSTSPQMNSFVSIARIGFVVSEGTEIEDIQPHYPTSNGNPTNWSSGNEFTDTNEGKKYLTISLSLGASSMPLLNANEEAMLFSFRLSRPSSSTSCISNDIRFYDSSIDPSKEELNGGDYQSSFLFVVSPNETITSVFDFVSPDLSPTPNITTGENLEINLSLQSTNCFIADSYLWEGPMFSSTQQEVVITNFDPQIHNGTYTVTVTDNLGCTSSASATVSVLPVEYDNISVTKKGAGAQLSWSTAMEVNCEEFIVQKSLDGKYFIDVDRTNCKNQNGAEYNYFEHTIKNGTTYFRLLQKDFDGQMNYSDVLSIYKKEDSPIVVVEEGNFLRSTSDLGRIAIYSTIGELLMQLKDAKSIVDISKLTQGIYFLHIEKSAQTIKVFK